MLCQKVKLKIDRSIYFEQKWFETTHVHQAQTNEKVPNFCSLDEQERKGETYKPLLCSA